MKYTKLTSAFALSFLSLVGWGQPGVISTVVGIGTPGFSGDGGPATACQLQGLNNVTISSSGDLYISDALNQRVRKVKPDGLISTVAGNGVTGFGGNGGPATSAMLNMPSGTLMLPSGDLLISDLLNHQIRKVSPAGVITTFAGSGVAGYSGDGGAATAARFNRPYGLAIDATGNIYVADQYNHRVRKISPSGIVTTAVGTGASTYTGDGGPATAATIKYPNYVCISNTGDLYVTDNGNQAIRKVNSSGIISTVAGSGVLGFSGDGGPATLARLNFPGGIKTDAVGNLYITDHINNRIRKVSAAGIITTIAGTGVAGYTGDGGPATAAQFNMPLDIVFNAAGDMLVADYNNNRVRKIAGVAPTGVPVFTGVDPYPVSYCVSEAVVAYPVDTLLKATDSDLGQTLTWSIVTPPSHGAAMISYSASSTGGLVTPSGLTYTPALGYTGADMYSVRVFDGTFADTITINVTIEGAPAAGVISGPDTVCQGGSISLSGSVSGTWSAITGMASVTSGGTVSGVMPGADTVLLTVTNSCGSIVTRHAVWVRAAADCSASVADVGNTACSVYPNPSNGDLFVNVGGAATGYADVAIYNSLGQNAGMFRVKVGERVPLSLDLPPGAYLLVAKWDDQSAKKIVLINRR